MKLDAEAQRNAMYTVQHFFFSSTGCGGSNLQRNVVYLGPHFFSPVHDIVARTALLLRAAEIKTRAPHTSDARGAAVQTRRRAAIQTQWRAAAYL